MGIVIINGKRYDSITGLMIRDQNREVKTKETEMTTEAQRETPSWINDYVSMRQQQRRLDRVSATGTEATDDFTISQAVAAVAQQPTGKVMRRRTGSSETLNRRFVRKPLDERGDYAASPVERELAAKRQSATAKHIAIEQTQAEPAETASYEWHMVLGGQPQAATQQITQPTAATSFGNPNLNQYEELSPEHASGDDAAATDQTIEELNKILHSAREIDSSKSTQNKHSKRSDRKAARAEAKAAKRQEKRRSFSLRTAVTMAGALGVVVAIGVYVAMPTISVKMAASKAGIDAKNPYAPKGYTIDGKVAYGKGKVVINYHGKNDGDGYTVTQEKSDQTTSDLLSDLTSKGEAYDEVRTSNKSIYLTSDNATWVENGIKYTIKGNDYLDTEQITDIAASL